MKNRRDFLKVIGGSGIGLAVGGGALASSNEEAAVREKHFLFPETNASNSSIIGIYGEWANSLLGSDLPNLSYRKKGWKNIETWREVAKKSVVDHLSIPEIGKMPKVKVNKKYTYDGLDIEELSWELSYGRATKAIVLKPTNAKGRLPGILAFYDHGLQKFYGVEKITRTSDDRNSIIDEHQRVAYEGKAWANEIAKRGYVVMVADVFPFGSRRVMIENVPEEILQIWPDLDFRNPGSDNYIKNYNIWAAEHEHVMAKSLFSAGTSWPALFFGEDRISLDILCDRDDVDANRIGCGGLSGGGVRTNFMGGLDSRIKCAVSVAFQTTWKDLIIHKSYTHTWMAFPPLVPKDLEHIEILGLRVPLPTMVLNNSDDELFTLSEQKRANKILEDVFKKANSEDKYMGSFHPGPHKFDAKMQKEAFDWFDKWLKN